MENYLVMIQEYIAAYGFKIIEALLILIIGLWAAKLLTKSFNKMMLKKGTDVTLVKFFTAMVRIALIIFVIIAAISQAGIETMSFVAVLGGAGLAVGLALQGSLSNFASGVMLIIFKPIKVGDFIEGGGNKGIVEEIGIFVTTLKSPDNKVIFVPNSKLASDNIVNYSLKDKRRVDMVFGIGYGDNINQARMVINEVLKQNANVLQDPVPDVFVSELGDSSVNFVVRPWCKTEHYWNVYFSVTEEVKKKFDDQNIEIPFPQRDLLIYQN